MGFLDKIMEGVDLTRKAGSMTANPATALTMLGLGSGMNQLRQRTGVNLPRIMSLPNTIPQKFTPFNPAGIGTMRNVLGAIPRGSEKFVPPQVSPDQAIPTAVPTAAQTAPATQGVSRPNTGTMQGPIVGNDARVTAWDLDPKYQVINKLTQEEFMKPFQSQDPKKIVKDVVEIVIQKIGESGYTITPEFEAWMRANAEQATAEWAQSQKAAGKQHLMAADYYMMMAEFAVTGAQQFAQQQQTPQNTQEQQQQAQSDDGTLSDEEVQSIYLNWATQMQQSNPNAPVDFEAFLAWLDAQEGAG